MRSSIVFAGAALTSLVSAQSGYVCPITPPKDATALEFAFAVQKFLYNYYEANANDGDYSADMFTSFPNSTELGENGMPRSSDLAANFGGLKQQSMLGGMGIKMLAQNAGSGYMQPDCDYKYPPGFQSGGSAMDFVTSAYFIEATLCGAFIGLADYVQTPQAAFLMARLAAEHGIHASFLGSYLKDVPYSADSMSLTPAFTPEMLMRMGSGQGVRMDVGKLGEFIPSTCAPLPPAPCGGSVEIGMINAMLNGASGMGGSYSNGTSTGAMPSGTSAAYPGSTGGMMNPSSSSSPMPQPYTGDAASSRVGELAILGAGALGVAALMM